jgi:hypothetical protein
VGKSIDGFYFVVNALPMTARQVALVPLGGVSVGQFWNVSKQGGEIEGNEKQANI